MMWTQAVVTILLGKKCASLVIVETRRKWVAMMVIVDFSVDIILTDLIGHQQSASSSTPHFIGCEKEVRLKWPNSCTLLWFSMVANGSGRVNIEGLAHYNRFINSLLAQGTFQKVFKYSCLDVANIHMLQKLIVMSTCVMVDVYSSRTCCITLAKLRRTTLNFLLSNNFILLLFPSLQQKGA